VKRAVVVPDGHLQVEAVLGALASAGFEAVAASSPSEARSHLDAGAVVLVMGSSGDAGETGLATLAGMPPVGRRACVVALIGPSFTTGDGMRAFLLGADQVVAAADGARLGEIVCAALASKRVLVAPLDPLAAAKLGG
jgi:hypothetical protein